MKLILGFLLSANTGFSNSAQMRFVLKTGNYDLPDEPLDFNMLQLEIVKLTH